MQVWGVASREDEALVRSFAEQLGLTYPILLDTDGAAIDLYALELAFDTTKYPQDWIVGSDGTVVYVNDRYDPAAMRDVLDEELAQ